MSKKSDLAKIRASLKALDTKIRGIPLEIGSNELVNQYAKRTPRSGAGDHEACALVHYLKVEHGFEVFSFSDREMDEGIIIYDDKKIGIKSDYPSALFRSLLHESSHLLTHGKWDSVSYKEIADSVGMELPAEYGNHQMSFEDEIVAETVAVVVGELYGQKYADSSAWFMAANVCCVDKDKRLIRALNSFGGIEVVENTALQLAEGIRQGLNWLHTEGPLATANT